MDEENIYDNNLNNNENEENFEALFKKSSTLPGRIEPGQKVKSVIVGISGDLVYIDLGGKTEGVVDIKEFFDEAGDCQVKVGGEIEVFFTSVQNGLKRFTTLTRGLSSLHLSDLRNAYEAGLPVSGKVKSELKGGYEVSMGKARCFCPYSQIDVRGNRETTTYIGGVFPFRILEFEEDGRNIIVSRRVLIEEEQALKKEKLKEELKTGMELKGKVKSIHDFGIFVDIGSMDGFIPLSELEWDRTKKPEDVLSVGQDITAKIISLDWAKGRLTLSLKALQPDPWIKAAEKYTVDSPVKGVVVRITPFGVFVNLEPGIDGLIHISKLGAGRRIKHPKEVVEEGQWIEAFVSGVDTANKRISLSKELNINPEKVELPSEGETLEGVVDNVMPYGIFLKFNNGISGLVPNSEMGTPKGTNHSRMFPPGTAMTVIVTKVDHTTGKISLSKNLVGEKSAQVDFSKYKEQVKNEEKSASGMGSFGELLQAKLKGKIRFN
jgi:small subunit ribosomal protein S1